MDAFNIERYGSLPLIANTTWYSNQLVPFSECLFGHSKVLKSLRMFLLCNRVFETHVSNNRPIQRAYCPFLKMVRNNFIGKRHYRLNILRTLIEFQQAVEGGNPVLRAWFHTFLKDLQWIYHGIGFSISFEYRHVLQR